VRLRLWTAAISGAIIHPPSDIWAWRFIEEWYRQQIILILPPELSGNHTSRVIL
jgi:hypothetical protein